MTLTVREQVMAQVQTTLAAINDINVFRNRSSRLNTTEMPAVMIYDGGSSATDRMPIQFVTLSVDLELFVTADDDDDLGPALSALYGQVHQALLNEPLLNNGTGAVAFDTRFDGSETPVIDKQDGTDSQLACLFKFVLQFQQDSRDPTSFGPA